MSSQAAPVYQAPVDEKHQAEALEDIEQDAVKGSENAHTTVVVTDDDVSTSSFIAASSG